MNALKLHLPFSINRRKLLGYSWILFMYAVFVFGFGLFLQARYSPIVVQWFWSGFAIGGPFGIISFAVMDRYLLPEETPKDNAVHKEDEQENK